MSSPDQEADQRVAAVVLVSAIVLAVGLVLGVGLSRTAGGATGTVAQPIAAKAVEAPVAPLVSVADEASVVVDSGVVKFYFAPGKADLPSGALSVLGDVIAAARAGQRLVLSGYHDATGDPARNAELARQRALAVRAALLSAGVDENRLELKKPEETVGDGPDAEARRVEVRIGG